MGANAQTAVPTFTASQVLTAAQMNQSARTGVPVFASTVTRDAAFGGTGEKTLAEGQMCYVEGVGLQSYNAAGAWVTWGAAPGAVVQIKSTAKTDTFTTTSSTFTDITGLSVSITPTSASNNVLVIATVNVGSQPGTVAAFTRLMRGTTAIGIGDTAGNRTRSTNAGVSGDANQVATYGMAFLDSPATTSATTYKLQLLANVNGQTVSVNRGVTDTDAATTARTISTITVFEVTP